MLAAFSAHGASGYEFSAWTFAYSVMAASILVGVISVLLSPEPPESSEPRLTLSWKSRLKQNFVDPFRDLYVRFGKFALWFLLIILLYRVADVVMGVMANPFYADMGFSKEEVAAVSKVFGVIMTLAGAFIGGAVVLRLGVMKTLLIGGVLTALTNVLFSVLAGIGHNLTMLIFTVSADNLASGLASSAFVAFLSGLTSKEYSATQYAFLSSLMLLIPKFLAGFSGVLVESIGYSSFFLFTATLGIPVCVLILMVIKCRSSTSL